MDSGEKRKKSYAKEKRLANAISHHSLTGLNITIFYQRFFNISYCYYNQQEKLENDYQTLL